MMPGNRSDQGRLWRVTTAVSIGFARELLPPNFALLGFACSCFRYSIAVPTTLSPGYPNSVAVHIALETSLGFFFPR